ncbi:hypothetical protein HWV62_37173 [Athelia sp. TMB]|nr:hypothetical protein HWV62_37173 [Athelia sp. TMB]
MIVDRPSPMIVDEAEVANTIHEANRIFGNEPTFRTENSENVFNIARDYNYIDQSIIYNDGAGGAFFFHRADNSFLKQHHLSGTRAEVTAAVDTNARVKGIQDDQKNDRIKTWMKAPDTSLNYKAALDTHQGGTGSWFTSCPEFVTWKQEGSVLWLQGKRGCSSLAIKDVKTVCAGAVSYAYFFFDGRDGSELSRHESLIRSLIIQFSAQCDGIPLALDELYAHECRNGLDQPSIASLERTLQLIVNSFDAAYIIVDALDECDEQRKLLQWIRSSMASKTSGQLHLLVISRPEPDIKSGLAPLNGLIVVSVANQRAAGEIRRYIEARLSEESRWVNDSGAREMIVEGLVGRADGMLRWVALQYDDLMRCRSKQALKKQLESLPHGLNETYEKILARTSPLDVSDLKLFLQLLACASRPLKLTEIAEAVVVTSSPGGSDDMPFCDLARRYEHPNDVLRICYGLVTEVDGTVKLAHFSVKEFLSSVEIKLSAAKYFYTNESLSHSASARICLVYLLQFDKPESFTKENINALPLSSYAARYFDFHVRSTGAVDTDPNQHLLQRLFEPVPNYALASWAQLRDTHIIRGSWIMAAPVVDLENGSAPLYFASIVGLTQVVPHLINQGADPNVPSGPEGTTLHGAAFWGRLEVFKLLLQLGADISINVGKHGTVLQAASSGGSAEIAKMLLEQGADPNISGGVCGSALQAASYRRSAEIVTLLLAKGADPNIGGGEHGSALQAASYRGSAEIVTLLLAKGADPNIGGGKYGSALQAASDAKSAEINALLLENGADPNIGGGEYGSALQAASFHGSAEIVRLLLENGADPNIGGGQYGSALQAASFHGSAEIVRLLLEKGAEPNIGGGYFGSALQAASFSESAEIVTLLLERGADTNIGGGKHGSALQAASFDGSAEIVRLLLENGADPNIGGGEYGSALKAASCRGPAEIVTLLLEAGAHVNAQGGGYGTALQAACYERSVEIVKVLLEWNADVNIVGGEYGTALQAASYSGKSMIVELLLQNGADVNAEGGRHGTAIRAARAARTEYWRKTEAEGEVIVRLLQEYGAVDVATNVLPEIDL